MIEYKEKQGENSNYIRTVFYKDINSFEECLKILNESPNIISNNSSNKNAPKDDSFNDFVNFDKYLENLETNERKYKNNKIKELKNTSYDTTNKRKRINTLAGNPNIGKYLAGNPRNCNNIKEIKKSKVKNFYIYCGFNCDVSVEEFEKKQEKSYSIYESYKGPKTCKLLFISHLGANDYFCVTIDVTKYQKENMQQMKQLLLSADTLRRVKFKLMEIASNEVVAKETKYGYGSSVSRMKEMKDVLGCAGIENISIVYKGEENE